MRGRKNEGEGERFLKNQKKEERSGERMRLWKRGQKRVRECTWKT